MQNDQICKLFFFAVGVFLLLSLKRFPSENQRYAIWQCIHFFHPSPTLFFLSSFSLFSHLLCFSFHVSRPLPRSHPLSLLIKDSLSKTKSPFCLCRSFLMTTAVSCLMCYWPAAMCHLCLFTQPVSFHSIFSKQNFPFFYHSLGVFYTPNYL